MTYEKALAHRLIAHDYGLYASFDKNEAYMARRWPRDTFRWDASSDIDSENFHDDEANTVYLTYQALEKAAEGRGPWD